jgi:Acyl-CoA carboxylase epsilon subunit
MTGLIEVVRGHPDDIELAALLAVLLARSAARSRTAGQARPAGQAVRAGWRNGEAGYRSPRSWTSR